jgi:hypothetical protein
MQQHKQHKQAQAQARERPTGARVRTPSSGPRAEGESAGAQHPQGPLPEGVRKRLPPKAQHIMSARVAAAALSALAVLLAALALAGTGGSVYASPRSGGPTLDVTNIADNRITVMGTGWIANEAITLSYSTSSSCLPSTALPVSSYTVTWDGSNFQATLTWPSTIGRGVYYLCASGSNSGGPIATQQTIIINNNGTVQPTPGSTTPPNATATGKPPATTGTPGHNPGSTATTGGSTGNGGGGNSNPGNKGASASTSVSSLVAIILLCLLVLALLVYLIRIWLQGRQAGGPTP